MKTKNIIKNISDYNGRFCAELATGKFVLSNGSMELLLCDKVETGMKVIKAGIIGGIAMRTENDFRFCVENSADCAI